jgi:hyperpolarization activated cyclic nucleotide-gated potassium channel 2
MWIFETLIDSLFLVDIIISFNTGFYKKGYLVMKRREIIMNYLKTWFIIDLVASFPYTWFFPI